VHLLYLRQFNRTWKQHSAAHFPCHGSGDQGKKVAASLGARPPAPSHCYAADETGAEQCDGCWLGHCCNELGDYDLPVTALEIGDEDLVYSRVEGATTATGTTTRGGVKPATAADQPRQPAVRVQAGLARHRFEPRHRVASVILAFFT
jgi:hypothetical protein